MKSLSSGTDDFRRTDAGVIRVWTCDRGRLQFAAMTSPGCRPLQGGPERRNLSGSLQFPFTESTVIRSSETTALSWH
jgi:hypothetical protein